MKKLMAVIAVGCLLQLAGGQAAAKKPSKPVYAVNPDVVATFKPGVTTMAQVEAVLGNPVKTARVANGDSLILYAKRKIEDVDGSVPETGSALPKRHRVQYSTVLSFDPQGRFMTSLNRVDDLGDSSPSALGHFDAGDVLTNADGMP
ncbi:MAG TPA: hypothetical protein VL997_03910 [Dyella sp.]|nr:hypothetical protein [Dyella sp.]